MSDTADKSSKTEEPTEKKIRDSVEKGNLPVSREAPILGSLLAAMAFLTFQLQRGGERLGQGLQAVFENPAQWDLATGRDALHLMHVAGLEMAWFIAPAAALFILAGILSSVLQNAPQINAERIRPKWSNVSPAQGWTRMFGARGFTEFGKSVFKFGAISVIVMMFLVNDLEAAVGTMFTDPAQLPETILTMSMQLLSAVSIATIVLVAADLMFSRVHWRRDLRMTKQEIKDEHKQAEGDPMVKARQRQIARDRSRKRMMASVPKATLVIANPTHYAIALRYVREEGGAPLVVAKGVDLVALKIREVAEANDIPVIEDKLLARSMYDHVDVDQMIPPQFFKAVAELIYYLHAREGARVDVGVA
ncbi:flagellar biosynthesis protein FlhB [Aureimonas mangrovi]|uniref:flagellar biosynthesis protein FlhB n=1 Tax=Aureimonas mangrovi TaxID=2758041 RepID=UPI00163DCAC5|nr:flagellar biosynthesis protein FlhB [Aureimonas mangrovi]